MKTKVFDIPGLFRKTLQFAYCLDYDEYCKIMGQAEDYYSKGKWELMQKNFSRWYCDLDSQHAKLFMGAVIAKYEGGGI